MKNKRIDDAIKMLQSSIKIYDGSQYGTDETIMQTKSINDKIIIFILGEYEGKLAVLSPDKKIVHEIFDVYINTLPAYDKELLHNGIQIKSTEQLNSLIEDYTS